MTVEELADLMQKEIPRMFGANHYYALIKSAICGVYTIDYSNWKCGNEIKEFIEHEKMVNIWMERKR